MSFLVERSRGREFERGMDGARKVAHGIDEERGNNDFALIRRVEIIYFPFSFGYQVYKAKMEKMGLKWKLQQSQQSGRKENYSKRITRSLRISHKMAVKRLGLFNARRNKVSQAESLYTRHGAKVSAVAKLVGLKGVDAANIAYFLPPRFSAPRRKAAARRTRGAAGKLSRQFNHRLQPHASLFSSAFCFSCPLPPQTPLRRTGLSSSKSRRCRRARP